MPFNIVLLSPRIPQNTGNIARLCAATNSVLHLIHPLGFSLADKDLKRAGLDYWDFLKIEKHINFESFLETYDNKKLVFLSSKVKKPYWDYKFEDGMFLVFGSETGGIPSEVMGKFSDQSLTIPQYNENVRCLNLSNSVSIVLYEALRQTNF